ncbi:MAG: hypothetical protein JWQ77_991 [Jatrophihabitans sp.]|nr:hypothetical protein [Jatrophihabitans sp.]
MSTDDELVLLATCSAFPDGDEDSAELLDAFQAQGIEARWVVWDDRHVDWSQHLVVVRSTWDYTQRRQEFLSWTRSVPRLANRADVIAWSSDKVYLRELAQAGVPTVPTAWVAPGERTDFPQDAEYVIKPSVGAGSRGTGRFRPEDALLATAHVEVLHSAGQTVLVQPYLDEIDASGETALIYIDGRFSHAVTKGAMLEPGVVNAIADRSLFVEERISPREPSDIELGIGNGIVDMLTKRFGTLLYTRVDLLPGPDGPMLVELELAEPSLFLTHGPGSADLLAVAAARLI